MLHRHLPHDHVVAGLATALRAGALTADAVALEARKYNDTADGGADDTTADHQSLMSGDRAHEARSCRAIADRAPAPRPHPGRHSAAAERGVRPAVGQPT